MSKKDLYFSQAENLYVVEQMPVDAIGRQLKINEKTIRSWRDAGEWPRKRADFLASKHCLYSDIYELCGLIVKNALEDLRAGKKVSTGQLYALVPMLGKVLQVRDVEETLAQLGKPADDSKKDVTAEILKAINEQLLGTPAVQPAKPAAPESDTPAAEYPDNQPPHEPNGAGRIILDDYNTVGPQPTGLTDKKDKNAKNAI